MNAVASCGCCLSNGLTSCAEPYIRPLIDYSFNQGVMVGIIISIIGYVVFLCLRYLLYIYIIETIEELEKEKGGLK